MSLERNCALCMDTSCDKQGTPDNFAEMCHGWDEPAPTTADMMLDDKLADLEGQVIELRDDLDRLESLFNRILRAVMKEVNQ